MKKPLVIHPFLFAIYPVAALYYHGIRYLSFPDTLAPLAVLLSFTVFFMLLFKLIRVDIVKSGIILSIFLLIFFSYGHASHLVRKFKLVRFEFLWDIFLIFICILLFSVCVIIIIRTKRSLYNFTRIVNVTSIVLVGISLFNIALFTIKTRNVPRAANNTVNSEVGASGRVNADSLPDIYYIIFDRYTNSDALKDYYNYDNSDLIDFLSEKGFYVVPKSYANYHRTAHSLSSSLNMEYINHLRDTMGEDSADWRPLFTLIQDYKVWRFLKSKGYTFLHFGSHCKATEINLYADKNYNFHALPEFSRVLYGNTILKPIGEYFKIFDERKEHWKRVQYKFDTLADIADMKEPTYVFAHMLVPHPPFVFDENGNYLSKAEEKKRTREENYMGQLIYINKKIKELVNEILSRSKTEPIIVLQGDEGPFPKRVENNFIYFDWRLATVDEIKMKMGILNAYYLPNADKDVLYPSITPVNSFRLIFNIYFNENYELLPDKYYTYQDDFHLYKFIDVTDTLR